MILKFDTCLVNGHQHSMLRAELYTIVDIAQKTELNGIIQGSMKLRNSRLSFSNSGINKVAMVKNALLPMSLYSLLWVNEIIRYHLHIVDRSTMCK